MQCVEYEHIVSHEDEFESVFALSIEWWRFEGNWDVYFKLVGLNNYALFNILIVTNVNY